MKERYAKAFKEIYIILNKTSKEEIDKIPKLFIEFIKENMNDNYEPEINFDENFENSVLEETLLILALIYRDYLISKEERKILLEEEKKQLENLKQSYNIEVLFKKEDNLQKQLIEVKEEKWYKKILNKILNIIKH